MCRTGRDVDETVPERTTKTEAEWLAPVPVLYFRLGPIFAAANLDASGGYQTSSTATRARYYLPYELFVH